MNGYTVIEQLTTAMRDNIPSALRKIGLRIFNTDTGADERWDGTGWQPASGASSYTYIGYANDASGAGFSLSPAGKTFIAFRTSPTPLTPVPSDFAGLWVEFVGAGSSSSGLPAKRLIIKALYLDGGTNFSAYQVIDMEKLSLLPRVQQHFEVSGSAARGLAAKNGTSGIVLEQQGNRVILLNTNLEYERDLTGNISQSGYNHVGFVYDAGTDAFYGMNPSSQLIQIASSNFAITPNTSNPLFGASGKFSIGGGKIVCPNGASAAVFDTALVFSGTVSPSHASLYGAVYNPDKARHVLASSSGYVEINPVNNAFQNFTVLAGAFDIAYANGKYCLMSSSTGVITLVDANTGATITQLTTAEGLLSQQYHQVIAANGYFVALSDNSIVFIDIQTNSVAKVLRISPQFASLSSFRQTMAYQDIS